MKMSLVGYSSLDMSNHSRRGGTRNENGRVSDVHHQVIVIALMASSSSSLGVIHFRPAV